MNVGRSRLRLSVDGAEHDVSIEADSVTVDGQRFGARVERSGTDLVVLIDGRPYVVEVGEPAGSLLLVGVDGTPREVELGASVPRPAPAQRPAARSQVSPPSAGGPAVVAPMAGRVLRVSVATGDSVAAGDLLLILEAMKMENEIRAASPGIVQRVLVTQGERVAEGAPLIVLG